MSNDNETKPLPIDNDVAKKIALQGSVNLCRALADLETASSPEGLRKYADDLERQELGAVELWDETMGDAVQSVLREAEAKDDDDDDEDDDA